MRRANLCYSKHMGKILWRTIIVTVVHTWTLEWSETTEQPTEAHPPTAEGRSIYSDPTHQAQVDPVQSEQTALPPVRTAVSESISISTSSTSSLFPPRANGGHRRYQQTSK
jgi:hypothetical protein